MEDEINTYFHYISDNDYHFWNIMHLLQLFLQQNHINEQNET